MLKRLQTNMLAFQRKPLIVLRMKLHYAKGAVGASFLSSEVPHHAMSNNV